MERRGGGIDSNGRRTLWDKGNTSKANKASKEDEEDKGPEPKNRRKSSEPRRVSREPSQEEEKQAVVPTAEARVSPLPEVALGEEAKSALIG